MSAMKGKSRIHMIGDSCKRRVMLIHGAGFYWETCFASIADALRDKYCLLIAELEGHCHEPDEFMVSVEESADKIIHSLNQRAVRDIDIIYGISLGASIALEIALKNKLSVSTLILDSGQYESMGEMTEQYSAIMAGEFKKIINGEHLISPVKENMGYLSNNDVDVLQPLIFPDITQEALYRAFLAAYSYDIKERSEKLGMKVGILLGGNEIYAKNSIPLVERICLKAPDIHEFPHKGHAEALSREPRLITGIINKYMCGQ
ncbi:alpha/beta hydrolase family protein [Ruminiclostridium hungatei]|uniref:Alpha/beta hydrolase family protein n=1 Tax=Ruminiclostridium hungatei TaxID=48256 RepID=A0A1V4SNU3_RUMHU|nr:alpha/beta hydrolase [Ruminiclostridium hungatei]OPX44921.1 alpha/beta hydrolase family protein [Ruminiclostridium hungatei]